jgi:MerR family transcriptional regulator/heat shock protein HspR
MNEQSSITRIVLHHYHVSSSYSEGETAEVSHLDTVELRHLRALGLIEGQEIGGEWRYSEEDVSQLRRIRRLQHDLGINLAGVEVILHLLRRLETTYRELEQAQQTAIANKREQQP